MNTDRKPSFFPSVKQEQKTSALYFLSRTRSLPHRPMQTFPRVNLYLALFITFFTWAIYQTAPNQVQDVEKHRPLTRSPEDLSAPLTANTKVHDKLLHQKITVRSGDNLANIFERHGISSGELQKLMESNPMFRAMKTLRPGEHFI